jgi:hypothetical protein
VLKALWWAAACAARPARLVEASRAGGRMANAGWQSVLAHQDISSADCYRILNLADGADPAEIRAAFRRLARENHPDLNRGPDNVQRFIKVVVAYRTLQHELDLHPDGSVLRFCPRCGRYAELLDGLDGRAGCAECLLGDTQRRRMLPGPLLVVAKHVSVFGLEGASIALMIAGIAKNDVAYYWMALPCAVVGFLILAITCLVVRDAF